MSEDNPLLAASHLTTALRENTAALRAVKRRYRILVVAIVFMAAVLVVSLKSRHDARVEGCIRDNELRSGLLHIADTIERDGSNTPEAKAFVEELRRDFATRDCEFSWL